MSRKLFSPLFAVAIMAASALGAVASTVRDTGAALVAGMVLGLAFLAQVLPAPAARLFYVAHYRAACFLFGVRRMLGAALFSGMCRAGMILRAFPGSVTADLAFGVPGELAFDGPYRSQPARINHGTAADIVVGRWFTLAADGTARPGGTGAIGGVFINPKSMSSLGTAAGGALAPTLTVPTGVVGEFGYMGAFVVPVSTAVAIGQAAFYDTTTGAIGAGAPSAGQAAIPNSKFIRYANAAAGLAVLELTN